jgi:PleD family two-component response regulator
VADEAPQADETDTLAGALVLVESTLDEAIDTEALQSELGRSVVVVDFVALGDEAFEQLAQAATIVVPWDLGPQCGLDVVEALLHDERTRHAWIAMASPAPTRAAVALARSAGAHGFVFQPYRVEELERHLAARPPASDDESVPESAED